MNKDLTLEYLYQIFDYSLEYDISPSVYFPSICKNRDFINMVNSKPFDITNILDEISKHKSSNISIDKNQIRFLAFLISEFLDRTEIPIEKVPKYIDIQYVFLYFNQLHSQDITNIIFDIFTRFNEKYRLRKTMSDIFLDEEKLLQNFLRLYPIKEYRGFDVIFDPRLRKRIYIYNNNVLLLSQDLKSLSDDEYFKQRYIVGNKVYCFTNETIKPHSDFSLYLFSVSPKNITLTEPSGLKHLFTFSN